MEKILILANNDIGLYKFRKELIEKLLESYEVYISLPNGDYIKEFESLGCIFLDTPINRRGINPIEDLKLFFFYNSIVKKIKPDVVLSYTIKPNIYGGFASRINKTKYITNITGLGSSLEKKNILQKIILMMYKAALKKASCIFFQNTENSKLFIDNKITQNNFKILPGSGVNLKEYPLIELPNHKNLNFLFVSRVMTEKGIDQYLDMAKHIKKRYPYTKFHIVGFCEEDYEDILKTENNKGTIIYHGFQKDLKKFYASCHCLIHPTYYPEGMSNVLLEGAATARPLITTNRSGCKEIVDNKINGFLTKTRNSKDLIEKVEAFIKLSFKEKREMGLASRSKVEKSFDRNLVVSEYLYEIKQLTR